MSLVQTGVPGAEEVERSGNPIDALIASHERIRSFLQLSASLARTPPAGPDAVRSTAHDIVRYFSEALPLHEADEDLSLAPLLRLAEASDDVLQALDVVQKQHPDIERAVSRALGMLQTLEGDPAQLARLAAQLASTAERLTMIWTPHLALEETTIFPAARTLLGPEQLQLLHQEMRERRSQPA